jgi:hypothetical protein
MVSVVFLKGGSGNGCIYGQDISKDHRWRYIEATLAHFAEEHSDDKPPSRAEMEARNANAQKEAKGKTAEVPSSTP